MNRSLLVGLALLTALAGAAVMQLKIEVGDRLDRLNKIADQIAADKKDIRVLKSELAALKSPERLEPKAIDMLGLMTAEPEQIIASPRAIPMKPKKQDTKAEARKQSAPAGGDT